ncbi:MAG: hypothetical protein Q7V56_04170 [Gammaproteobacteria bacterium]|nr:hypothetical protein [Gammaproteobacteria bacterium]
MKTFVATCLLFCSTTTVSASPYIELSYTDYRDSYAARSLYVDQEINGRDSVSVSVYEDSEYESVYVGLSRQFGNTVLGLSVGEAKISGKPTVGYNPWLWYDDGKWEGYAEYEYLKDDKDAWYYRSYLHANMTENLFAGLYSERGIGTGPLLGMQFGRENGGFKAWIVTPAVNEADVKAVLNLSIWLEF